MDITAWSELAPWFQAGWMAAGLTFLCWLLSVITDEHSWVDRAWSTAPILYAGWVAGAEGFSDVRLNLMFGLVALWGARLTFNFARKGGYWKGGEDYRWEILRQRMKPWQFQLFNATFIAPYQMFLIYLFTSPLHPAWLARGGALTTLDLVAAALFLGLLTLETVADEQMWAFQQDKRARLARGEKVAQGFFREGTYSWSRHPNYFAEISMWWVFYLFGVAASGQWLNWTLAGPVLLTLLFEGSVRFGESVSASKYPAYKDYQATTSRLIPLPPRARPQGHAASQTK